MDKIINCSTHDCKNKSNLGKFIGDLCYPCYEFITKGKGVHSQAYKNTLKLKNKDTENGR